MSAPPSPNGVQFWVETAKWFVDHLGPIVLSVAGVMGALIKVGNDAGKKRAQQRAESGGDAPPAPPAGNEWAAFADKALHSLQEQVSEMRSEIQELRGTVKLQDRVINRLRAWAKQLQGIIHDHETARNLPHTVFAEPDDDPPN